MPNIVHVITGLGGGGAEGMLFKLLSAMGTASFEPTVVSLTNEGIFGSRLRALGVRVEAIGFDEGVQASRWRHLRHILKANRPSIVQGWMYHGNFAAWMAKKFWLQDAKLLWNIRQSLDDTTTLKLRTRTLIRSSALLSSSADAIIYVSRESATQHHNTGYNASRTEVLPNGFDTQTFAPSYHERLEARRKLCLADSDFVVAHIARYHPVKDHVSAISAAAHVVSIASNVRFLFVGRDVTESNPTLQSLRADLALDRNVQFLGEYKDVRGVLHAADVLLLSSVAEGFPNVLGEAMSMAIPCVATRVGDVHRILRNEAQLVQPKDVKGMSRAILMLASMSEEQRRHIGAEARQHIVDHYSIARIARLYEDLYIRVCSR